jgi:hypothetical protein
MSSIPSRAQRGVARRRVAAIVMTCLTSLGACTSQPPGAAAALLDTTSELRSLQSPWLTYSQLLSLSGQLPIPATGVLYHYPRAANGDPTAAVGLGWDDSFTLVGTSESEPSSDDVEVVRILLDEYVARTGDALALAGELAVLEETNGPTTPRRESRMAELDAGLAAIGRELRELRDAIRIAQKPGIVITTWDSATGAGVAIGHDARDGALASREQRHGWAVLGGLRIAAQFFGNDIYHAYAELTPMERRALQESSIATYLLQARHVAYSAGLSAAHVASLGLGDPSAGKAGAAQLRIRAHLDELTRLTHSGAIGPLRWQRHVVDFAEFGDFAGGFPIDGWITVVAQLTSMRTVLTGFDGEHLPPRSRNPPADQRRRRASSSRSSSKVGS